MCVSLIHKVGMGVPTILVKSCLILENRYKDGPEAHPYQA